MKLNNNDLYLIVGGGFTAAFFNAIARITNTIYEIGKGIGSSLRRIIKRSFC